MLKIGSVPIFDPADYIPAMPRSFDALVIGAGQAGPPLAARLAGAGMKVAVIERGAFGGTCVNDGCTPTKAMVASAYAASLARRAAEYGVELPGAARVDMRRVKARKDAIVARSVQGIEKWMAKVATVVRGHARFAGPDRVRTLISEHCQADVSELSGLAAGSKPKRKGGDGAPTSGGRDTQMQKLAPAEIGRFVAVESKR